LGLGLFFAFFDKTPKRAVLAAAYITGAEILWRMTAVPIPYEFGKYAASLVLIVTMLNHLKIQRLPVAPFVYFALLIPSAFLVSERQPISYNLSGPLGLAVATIFFSRIRFTEPHLHRILLTMLAPLVGVATLCSFSTAMTTDVAFKTQALRETSGGWAPNQVSGVLGLGVVLIYLCLMHHRPNRITTWTLAGIAVWFCTQAALTFSRGGLILAGGAIAVAIYYTVGIPRVRRRVTLATVGAAVVTLVLIVPWLQNYTEGALLNRFSSLDTTGRDDLARSNITAFLENPVFGTGPGGSMDYAAEVGRRGHRAHTEYTRLLAEHGMFGAAALLLMAVMSWPRFFRAGPRSSKVYSASLTAWALLFMAYGGMRFGAVGFLFGLGAAGVLTKKDLLIHPLRGYQRESTLSYLERNAKPTEAGTLV
jgi:hypothetical protein